MASPHTRYNKTILSQTQKKSDTRWYEIKSVSEADFCTNISKNYSFKVMNVLILILIK